MNISKKEARRFILYHLNLLNGKTLKGKNGIMTYIKKVGCLQFDPLNIIAMNPHLVLQSRIQNYKPSMLNELLYKDRVLMDGWDKNMAIFPVEDRKYFKRYYNTAIETHTWRDPEIVEYIPAVREALKNGPSSSKDVLLQHKVDWAWAPTSAARALLDLMFFTGELMVYDKVNSRKIYDFTSNLLPLELIEAADPNISELDYHKWGILRRIEATGLLWDKRSESFLGIKGLKSNERQAAFKSLYKEKSIEKIHIDGLKEDFYVCKESLRSFSEINKKYHKRVQFIAPLDNLIWDRKLIKVLFDFDYKWEVYTPERDRKFGYYVLPILYGDEFIGRIEPVMDRKNKRLIVKGLWLDQYPSKAFKKAMIEFMNFLEVKSIAYGDKTPDSLQWLKKIMEDS